MNTKQGGGKSNTSTGTYAGHIQVSVGDHLFKDIPIVIFGWYPDAPSGLQTATHVNAENPRI